ncbi:MAG TPA: trypsin-like peptidase domain-containing protein [Vicinamibacterales bacterium]|nr:trypsin-like peptidase domain-containing protein [Vicinamibacterales bacterium]
MNTFMIVGMTRRFIAVTLGLAATVSFLIGLIVAGTMTPAPATSAPEPRLARARIAHAATATAPGISFADIAERLNPAVVNIDATMRGTPTTRRRYDSSLPGPGSPEFFDRGDRTPGPERDVPRRGAGTGFIVDPAGYILTNHHVIADSTRISVRLTDGRTLRAERIGSDPDTDIALIKVESPVPLPNAMLGDSDTLRVGEWVLAIGNPLAYEHTVTVGVVSFIGRKLFDSSLDRYIQTDAAINFGNSGGPLINTRGEVIGINAAISSRASNIGFAVPINQATAILPQLRQSGHVSRGFIGVALKRVDPDLQRSLALRTAAGALVQDVTPGSPGARAGLRIYDVIVAVDGRPVTVDDELIQIIASRKPGTTAALQIVRDGRSLTVPVKLAERPPRPRDDDAIPADEQPLQRYLGPPSPLGLTVRDIDAELLQHLKLPAGTEGVVVSRVDPAGPAFEADVQRGHVLLEINRRPVKSVADYRKVMAGVHSGDVLTLYLYKPEQSGRALQTVKID